MATGQPIMILAPQCPEGEQWVNVPWSDLAHTMPPEPSQAMRGVILLLKQMLREHPVDLHRLYVTGVSMGGFGTWDLLQRHSEMFAAGMPICGGGDVSLVDRMLSVKLHVFHGSADDVVWPIRSRSMVDALRACGAEPAYTEYDDVDHDSWTRTFANASVLSWLFAQRKTAGILGA